MTLNSPYNKSFSDHIFDEHKALKALMALLFRVKRGERLTTKQRIIGAFKTKHYLTSKDLVDIAGFRYGARLCELRKMGYDFPWKFKTNAKGKATKTTIYTMRVV